MRSFGSRRGGGGWRIIEGGGCVDVDVIFERYLLAWRLGSSWEWGLGAVGVAVGGGGRTSRLVAFLQTTNILFFHELSRVKGGY